MIRYVVGTVWSLLCGEYMLVYFFFFKQKTAYDMRISDWSSDVCSSDLLHRAGRLYNCAVVISRGRILGVVPKSFIPNYREYYEKRWFASGAGLAELDINVAGQTVPFGTDLLFAASDLPDFIFHAEICEDYWEPNPPSTAGALAGALILCNLSASNSIIGKARDSALLSAAQSMRTVSAYAYSAAGRGESTTDLAWVGPATVHQIGVLVQTYSPFGGDHA